MRRTRMTTDTRGNPRDGRPSRRSRTTRCRGAGWRPTDPGGTGRFPCSAFPRRCSTSLLRRGLGRRLTRVRATRATSSRRADRRRPEASLSDTASPATSKPPSIESRRARATGREACARATRTPFSGRTWTTPGSGTGLSLSGLRAGSGDDAGRPLRHAARDGARTPGAEAVGERAVARP